VASQEVIKQLATNGRLHERHAAHPFENPIRSPTFLSMFLIFAMRPD